MTDATRRPSDLDLRQHLDDLVEHCQRAQVPLRDAMRLLLPLLKHRLGSRLVAVICPDEHLQLSTFWEGTPSGVSDETLGRLRQECLEHGTAVVASGRLRLHAEALDFAGQRIGVVAAGLPRSRSADGVPEVLRLFAEEIDGYVGSIVAERRKQRLLMSLSSALKHPVLETGIRTALAELRQAIHYSAFLMLYLEQREDDPARAAVHLIADGRAAAASVAPERLWRALRAARADAPASPALYRILKGIGLSTFVHERLITGIRDETVLGEIIVSSDERSFSTFELDVIRILRGLLRLRLIDFNRERRDLLRSFSREHAQRLLSEVHYSRRYLAPRRKTLAIMFADLDGFTTLSERRLEKPEAVLRLVETWAVGVRQIVHGHQGVLDKIIGDCALALFGPPFFAEGYASEDEAVQDYCERALRTAIAVRDFTASLRIPGGGRLEAGTGLNVATLAVGMTSVGDNYTGYGRGMNETARLQDLADGGQILVSEAFHRRLGRSAAWRFSTVRRQGVPGVRNPLPYRELLDDDVGPRRRPLRGPCRDEQRVGQGPGITPAEPAPRRQRRS